LTRLQGRIILEFSNGGKWLAVQKGRGVQKVTMVYLILTSKIAFELLILSPCSLKMKLLMQPSIGSRIEHGAVLNC